MADWGGQHLQFAWFVTTTENLRASDAFQHIWGEEADTFQQNRVPNPAAPFLSQASTVLDNQIVRQVTVQPGRIDLIVAAQGNDDQPFGKFFSIDDVILDIRDRIIHTRGVQRDVTRQSIVATALKPSNTYNDAASIFYNSIGFDFGIPNASDLLFQINARKSVGDISINRIANFSVVATQQLQFMIGGGAAQAQVPFSDVALAARRQFDFNTVPDGRIFGADAQNDVWRILADEILGMAANATVAYLRE